MTLPNPNVAYFRTGHYIMPDSGMFHTATMAAFQHVKPYFHVYKSDPTEQKPDAKAIVKSDFKGVVVPLLILIVVSGIFRWKREGKPVDKYVGSLRNRKKSYKAFVVRASGMDVRIQTEEVLYVRSLGNYIEIHTLQGKIVTREPLYRFLALVPDASAYIRVHRCTIVRIDKISAKGHGNIVVGNAELKVGTTYQPSITRLQLFP